LQGRRCIKLRDTENPRPSERKWGLPTGGVSRSPGRGQEFAGVLSLHHEDTDMPAEKAELRRQPTSCAKGMRLLVAPNRKARQLQRAGVVRNRD